MGVYDYLRCEYPLPVGGVNDVEYQTKDTPSQWCDNYEITKDGRLRHKEWDGDDKWIYHDDISGEIYFYELFECGRWLEFCADFLDGVLLEIRLVSDTTEEERWK